MDHWINILPILVLSAACFFVLQTDSWKRILPGYAVIYLSAFSIIVQFWSFTFALIKLLSGLMALVIIGISIYKNYDTTPAKKKAEIIFRLVAMGLVMIIILFVAEGVSGYLSIPLEIVLASLIIIGLSLIQLGISHEAYKIFLALIVLFFGFELVFSTNETSLLVNGLLAFVSLLVALMGGYIIVNEFEEGEE